MDHTKYQPFKEIKLNDRKWPGKRITSAPAWCSVDLRDGNQSLESPMNLEQKIEFFNFLVNIGFKEIEIGFPSASDTEFMFTRLLIERNLIPDDVIIQVLTISREDAIKRTFESLKGINKAVVHLYNATSQLHREVVFNRSKEETTELAVYGARLINELAGQYGREHFIFEYSPECFTDTDLDYATEICNAVLDIWQPDIFKGPGKVIINLPSTVEMSTPNIYADQIEYICGHIKYREHISISLHAHNDRGTAVAATELGMMAGADRVEGTLFGNGERTGNADLLVLAMNLYSQGIDPRLNFSNIDDVIKIYEKSTALPVHPRHPYAGTLVYTAFSGTHQDAIKKGMMWIREKQGGWKVPYLPIDPMDVGRSYDPIIRVNSQSGKAGAAYILEQFYGIKIPKKMQQEFGAIVTKYSDTNNKELHADEIYDLFKHEYINIDTPVYLIRYNEETNGESRITAALTIDGTRKDIQGTGNGIIDAFCTALKNELEIDFDIKDYNEHSMEYGSGSRAITYMEITGSNGKTYFGAGVSSSISKSSLRAIISAVDRFLTEK